MGVFGGGEGVFGLLAVRFAGGDGGGERGLLPGEIVFELFERDPLFFAAELGFKADGKERSCLAKSTAGEVEGETGFVDGIFDGATAAFGAEVAEGVTGRDAVTGAEAEGELRPGVDGEGGAAEHVDLVIGNLHAKRARRTADGDQMVAPFEPAIRVPAFDLGHGGRSDNAKGFEGRDGGGRFAFGDVGADLGGPGVLLLGFVPVGWFKGFAFGGVLLKAGDGGVERSVEGVDGEIERGAVLLVLGLLDSGFNGGDEVGVVLIAGSGVLQTAEEVDGGFELFLDGGQVFVGHLRVEPPTVGGGLFFTVRVFLRVNGPARDVGFGGVGEMEDELFAVDTAAFFDFEGMEDGAFVPPGIGILEIDTGVAGRGAVQRAGDGAGEGGAGVADIEGAELFANGEFESIRFEAGETIAPGVGVIVDGFEIAVDIGDTEDKLV